MDLYRTSRIHWQGRIQDSEGSVAGNGQTKLQWKECPSCALWYVCTKLVWTLLLLSWLTSEARESLLFNTQQKKKLIPAFLMGISEHKQIQMWCEHGLPILLSTMTTIMLPTYSTNKKYCDFLNIFIIFFPRSEERHFGHSFKRAKGYSFSYIKFIMIRFLKFN